MKRPFLDRSNRLLIAGAVFVALLFQAMIPAGFSVGVSYAFGSGSGGP